MVVVSGQSSYKPASKYPVAPYKPEYPSNKPAYPPPAYKTEYPVYSAPAYSKPAYPAQQNYDYVSIFLLIFSGCHCITSWSVFNWQPPMPYKFEWAVKDDYTYNDYAHEETSDDKGYVTGSYRTLLPDGRTQIVNYKADDYTGYVADVKYEGEAKYPEYKPSSYKPSYAPAYPSPAYPSPAYPSPPYNKPAYPEPAYPKPSYPAPPAYKPSSYPAPAYKPAYAPAYPAPKYPTKY